MGEPLQQPDAIVQRHIDAVQVGTALNAGGTVLFHAKLEAHTHKLMFVSDFYNVANITSYNNQGRTVDGGSTWGLYRVRAPSRVRSNWS